MGASIQLLLFSLIATDLNGWNVPGGEAQWEAFARDRMSRLFRQNRKY